MGEDDIVVGLVFEEQPKKKKGRPPKASPDTSSNKPKGSDKGK